MYIIKLSTVYFCNLNFVANLCKPKRLSGEHYFSSLLISNENKSSFLFGYAERIRQKILKAFSYQLL